MRRLSLTLLCGLILAPAALAAVHATGDGTLELRAVSATTVVIQGKGAIWGQVDAGRLMVNDPVVGDGVVYVSGADKAPKLVNDTTTVYVGKNMHFRVTGGAYRLVFRSAVGIDLTAVGVGTAALTGDPAAPDTGDYALDGGKWAAVPLLTRSIPFGKQPLSSGP